MSNWSHAQVKLLIEEFEKNPILYSAKNKNKFARNLALQIVQNNLKDVKEGLTVHDIKVKWRGLKTNFLTEHKKVIASSNEDGSLYFPTLWYYNRLKFILDNSPSRINMETINLLPQIKQEVVNDYSTETYDESATQFLEDQYFEDVDRNYIDADYPSPSSSASTEINTNKRKRVMEHKPFVIRDASKVIMSLSNVITEKLNKQEPKDKDDIFGEFVAAKMKDIEDRDVRLEVEMNITKILYEGIKKGRITI